MHESKINGIKDNFFQNVSNIIPQFQNLLDEDKFKYTPSFVDTSISLYSGNYIYAILGNYIYNNILY